jgi:multidrug efflux pump subunit AcrA (membrane-fusion protein)
MQPQRAHADRLRHSRHRSMRIGSSLEIGNLKGLKLVPGMPVEAFIQTGKRSVLSYVIKPLEDQVARTFKEG